MADHFKDTPMLANTRYAGKLARQETFFQVLGETGELDKAIAAAGISRATYENTWRKNKEFAARATALRIGARDKTLPWDGSFADFRLRFFKHESPWFHLRAAEVLEEGEPGSVTLMLWPPEHAKSTMVEDWCSYKLAVDPSFRIMVASQSQTHGRKILRRVQNRMEGDGPYPEYVARWGPFAPQTSTDRKKRQPWGSDYFDVYKRGEYDERDYSMCALGIGGAVVGTRTDLLIIDDVQSLKTLNLTDSIVETIRQDWLSRPGAKGRTVIIGTRVGDYDVYQKMIDEGIIDNLILFPAHKAYTPWAQPVGDTAKEKKDNPANLPPENCDLLWPQRYTPREYLIMRVNAGEQAWQRNYMQAPTAAGEATFDEPMIEQVSNPTRSVLSDPPPEVRNIVIGLDPGFGTNALVACGMTDDRLFVLDWRIDHNLTSNAQIFAVTETLMDQWHHDTVSVTDLIIEDKAFQKGLMDDDALHALRDRYGFRVTGHTTGNNKYDENWGVGQMARSFARKEVDLPGADDRHTRHARARLDAELKAWRPFVKGTKLRQDLVMALWFSWIRWRQLRAHLEHRTKTIQTRGMSWAPTRAPLPSQRLRVVS